MAFSKCLVVGFLSCAAGTLSAQAIRGAVVENGTGVPVRDALLTLVDSTGVAVSGIATRSDSSGTFALYAPGPGSYAVHAVRIGYTPATSPTLRLVNREIARLVVPLSATAQEVASVVVVEKRPATIAELDGSEGFEFRRARFELTGEGHFLSAQEIGGLGSMNDLIGTGKFGGGKVVKVPVPDPGTRVRGCFDPKSPDAFFLDHNLPLCRVPVDSIWTLLMPGCSLPNDLPLLLLDTQRVSDWETLESRVNMSQVAGVEIYPRNILLGALVGSAPVGYTLTGKSRAPCATIMVWTTHWFDAMELSTKAGDSSPRR